MQLRTHEQGSLPVRIARAISQQAAKSFSVDCYRIMVQWKSNFGNFFWGRLLKRKCG